LATDVSGDGSVVVLSSGGQPALWFAGTARSIYELVLMSGEDLSSWALLPGIGISDDGLTLAGGGTDGVTVGNQCWHATFTTCDDGRDDDGDGATDFPSDPGCASPDSGNEAPKCQDGIDNDGDGRIDFDGGASANGGVPLGPIDPQCTVASKDREKAGGCGLGAELAIVLGALVSARSRS
jgi:hypothetical protein